jgi:hypothetical protein
MYSCQNDDDLTIDPTVPTTGEVIDVASIIEVMTTNTSGGVWEIEQAAIIKPSNDSTVITGTYIVEDDIFTFTDSTTQTINLHWKKGYDINMQAQNVQEASTDRNASSEDFTLTIDPDTGILTSLDNRITAYYATESGSVLISIKDINSNNALSIGLTTKNQEDYIHMPSTISNPQELFNYTVGSPITGFKISPSQNSLYLTNRNDLVQSQQFGLKYNLHTNTLTTFDFLQQDFATKNIEFLEGKVASLGGFQFQVMDYEFSEVETSISVNEPLIFNGTASLNDTAFAFGGYDNNNPDTNTITTWNMGDATYQNVATIPSGLSQMDGEIVDQVLYMFGGWNLSPSDNFGSSLVHTYHIDTGIQNQIQLPVGLRQVYTSTVENLIYVAGLEPLDTDNDGQINTTRPYIGVFNTIDSSFQEISIDLDTILDNGYLRQFQVIDNKAYLVVSDSLDNPNGYINSVYETTLN